jgi:hypothetical protein
MYSSRPYSVQGRPTSDPDLSTDPDTYIMWKNKGSMGSEINGINYGHDNMPKVPHRVRAEYRRLEDDNAGAIPEEHLLRPEEWRDNFFWPNEATTNQCTTLMRYFIDELGPWVSISSVTETA